MPGSRWPRAGNPITLPTGQRAFRSWSVSGARGLSTFALSISTARGQPDRSLRVRASGGSAQLDFGRDIYWEERTQSANPMLDAFAVASGIGRQASAGARRDRRRRFLAALRKSLDSEPFSESMRRSIARFYAMPDQPVDERQHWAFGARIIELCEEVCSKAGVGAPSPRPIKIKLPTKKLAVPATVLVVGGTGFIGRRLVAALVAKGVGVRVLSRNKNSAAIAFRDMPIEIHEGFTAIQRLQKRRSPASKRSITSPNARGRSGTTMSQGDIEPTRVLAEQAVAAGVKRFIYTGTIDSYDLASPRRLIKGDTALDRRIGRRNLYARSKAACEALLLELSRTKGLPLVILRPGIVIGAGADPAHLGVAQFMSETEVNYWGKGDNKLPLVLVEDVADALVKALDAPGIGGKPCC